MTWAAEMAVGLKTGVPWVMCKEDDAPDPVVRDLCYLICMSTIFLLWFCSGGSKAVGPLAQLNSH